MEYLFDEDNGIILDKVTRDRCIILTKARLTQIISIFKVFGDSAQTFVLETCRSAGERYVNEVVEGKKTDAVQFLNVAVQRFTDGGLGKIEIGEFNPETVELKIRIWNNFFAEIPNGESTYCNCVEAFIVGMYEGFLHETPTIEETKCIGKADPYCEWQITLQKKAGTQ
jgi:predicted hydrocarbon binding protein